MNQQISAPAQRDVLPDALRGIAAILVIAGHFIDRDLQSLPAPYYFGYILSFFHMPLFFFFGGYFGLRAERRPFLQMVRQRALRLLLPYVMWSSVAVAARMAGRFLQGERPWQETLQLWLDTLLYAQSMWFFVSLFIAYILGWLLLRVWDRWRWWVLPAAALFLFLPGSALFAWHKTQEMLPFFLIGLLLACAGQPYDIQATPLYAAGTRGALFLAGGGILLLSPLYILPLYALRDEIGFPLLGCCLAEVFIAGSVFVFLSVLFTHCLPLQRFFMWYGRYSMELYCLHMFFIKYLAVATPSFVLALPQPVSSLYYFIVGTGIGGLCVLLSHWGLDRIPPYRIIMLGQWPRPTRH